MTTCKSYISCVFITSTGRPTRKQLKPLTIDSLDRPNSLVRFREASKVEPGEHYSISCQRSVQTSDIKPECSVLSGFASPTTTMSRSEVCVSSPFACEPYGRACTTHRSKPEEAMVYNKQFAVVCDSRSAPQECLCRYLARIYAHHVQCTSRSVSYC